MPAETPTHPTGWSDVSAAGARLKTESVGFLDALSDLGRATGQLVSRSVQERPALTLGSVAACGYVLGGGVPKGLVRTAASVGTRLAFSLALRHGVAALLDPEQAPEVPETPAAPDFD